MRKKSIIETSASLARTLYPVADFATPFQRGRECVLVINPDSAFAAGNITVETDNATDGSFSDVHAAADVDAGNTRFYNVTLGDNIAVTVASRTAGSVEVFLLGDS
jgi:hypothetical protein